MSGGRYDYAYRRIECFAEELEQNAHTPERKAFLRLVQKVAKAAKAIEWVDSSDWGPGDENPHIQAALGEKHKELCLAELIEEGETICKTINEYINSTKITI